MFYDNCLWENPRLNKVTKTPFFSEPLNANVIWNFYMRMNTPLNWED